ncbi:MAG: PcfJ domain-containing protein [Alphaproteobacteria bacterium]|nr:PcfJ domain-containing protein [Alphaproteobacteria bacterium]
MTYTVENRLALLPAKVSMPFRQLLSAGQITEDVVHTVLDAGEITGDTSKLIGFSVGFLHLRGQGVPVHDVIRMAKTQNRRISLGWSAKRWKEEHDRLSRAEALHRMAQENVGYDVSKFEEHLPERFSGYLIRSSRRLGMEGLRQRHCVASYDSRLRNGNCAIAAVFVNKQRWTVELRLTNDEEAPLRIDQIKTRYNGLPPASVREKIHEILGIALKKTAGVSVGSAMPNYIYMENLRRILPVLRAQGIENVTISFEGYGDSGSIEDISYAPCTNENIKEIPVEHLCTASHFDDGQWLKTVTPQQSTLNEAIDELTYDYLEETGVDWYNNDGGYGELVIDVNAGTVALEVNVRYTESTTEYSAERDIITGEDI